MKITPEVIDEIGMSGIEYARKFTLILIVFDKEKKNEPQFATGIILKTDKGFVLTTAGHVIQGFKNLGNNGRLQIGKAGFVIKNLEEEKIKILNSFDFGIIKLEENMITKNNFPFLEMHNVSKKTPEIMDLVAYVGFPGCWKTVHSEKLITLSHFECIGVVETVEDDQFSIRISESFYEADEKLNNDLTDVGGLSGAPVFSLLDFNKSKRRAPLLIGWLYEGMAWGKLAQKHYAVHSELINLIDL